MTATDRYDPDSEYARFGPWIDVVTAPDDLPRLFRDHPLDLATARLALKVPRNIARRDATPDMDLYDHVLAVHDAGLTLLSRDGHDAGPRRAAPPRGFTATRVPLGDVVAIEDSVNLLRGRYAVHTRDGRTIDFRYSGSARAGLGRLTTVLRAAFAPPRAGAARGSLAWTAPEHVADLAALETGGDLALTADLRDVIAAHPAVTAWACHARRTVAPTGGGLAGAVRRLGHAWSPMVVQGAVLGGDATALELLGRHAWMTRGSAPVHSASRLTVGLGGLDRIEVTDHPRYEGAAEVALHAGAWTGRIAVPADSPVAEVLRSARG
ncbi:hypothetical protein [Demequina iriomotensis]|uniref:hypothetical protein n=1 Tax=Demequina iriomotensis TaxID=1536641 RepID=UPI00078160D2|nr:hypothetical protein [Demequina iriomotensis]